MTECIFCGKDFNPKRAALGYKTCLNCGDQPNEYTVAPAFNKGAYQLITKSNVKDIGK